ncbi:hypothetical protein JG687_00013047 [Phytophthora cactorum]|uniref:PiggyBac transposable element-derived protein domain-containing protein n=1 Tax=Phytophthora cactorum TaxID=29920 RepID=A0A8T1U073_9STRA|nr:hypothetical protein JG687_00013047 [Phytophthora cactorum]
MHLHSRIIAKRTIRGIRYDHWYKGSTIKGKKHVSPGNILVVDDCRSARKRREAKYTHDGLPRKTKIACKPESKETELKSLADGDSGVLLGFELVGGAVVTAKKSTSASLGKGTQ